MRKLIFGLVALGVILVLGMIIAVIAVNRIIAANRDVILARVRIAVGRSVEVQDIAVRLGGGLSIGLTQIEIGEDPEFGAEPFVRARDLSGRLKLRPLLKQRLAVEHVTLTEATIRVIRTADGRWNYRSLGRPPRRAQAPPRNGVAVQRVAATTESHADAAVFALLIDSLDVQDGTVVFADHSRTPAVTTSARPRARPRSLR